MYFLTIWYLMGGGEGSLKMPTLRSVSVGNPLLLNLCTHVKKKRVCSRVVCAITCMCFFIVGRWCEV